MTDITKAPAATCAICGDTNSNANLALSQLRSPLADFIRERHTLEDPTALICKNCASEERAAELMAELERDRGELSTMEREVSRKAAEHIAISAHVDELFEKKASFGQRAADAVAAVGGSWPFVSGFGVGLLVWICANSLLLRAQAFDPYPYILLNLVLSCLAALQAPIIMMSQNRVAQRDRMEADEDFKINLKAELEIGGLHEKMDHLLHVQWARLVEIQQAQLELLSELANRQPRSAQ
jgi:uncharacterized membrane protein